MPSPQLKWIMAGGCGLAFMSAAVNAGFLIRLGASVSHLTGDISRAAVDGVAAAGQISTAWLSLVAATFGFIAGAMTAGFFIHHPTLELGRPYGRSVTSIGICLLLAHFLLEPLPSVAVGLASFACGLQNALATHYRGMILRTTHLTGLLTDFGTFLGMRLRGHAVPVWKLAVPSLLALSFGAGSILGAWLVLTMNLPFLLYLGPAYVIGGIGWSVRKRWLDIG